MPDGISGRAPDNGGLDNRLGGEPRHAKKGRERKVILKPQQHQGSSESNQQEKQGRTYVRRDTPVEIKPQNILPEPDSQVEHKGPIPFELAKPTIPVIDSIQDEIKTIVEQRAISSFRQIITHYGGYSEQALDTMTDAQIVALGHRVIQERRIQPPPKDANGDGNIDLADTLIAKKAKKIESEREEQLTAEKVEEYSETEDGLAEAQGVTKKLVYETELVFPGSKIKFPVQVYRREDGSYVMNKLPTAGYSEEIVKRIIKGAGIKDGKIEFKGWEAKSTEERTEYLKSEFNLDTLSVVLLYNPREWGYASPDRNTQAAQGSPDNPRYLLADEMDFRDLLLEKWRGPDPQYFPTPAIQLVQGRLQAIDVEISRRIQWNGPDNTAWVMSAFQEHGELRNEVRNDPAALAALDNAFNVGQQQQLDNSRAQANQHYENVMQHGGDASVSDIRSEANQQLGQLTANWTTLDRSISQLMDTTRSKVELPGREGLRVWFALTQIDMLKQAHEVLKRTEVHADPIENIEAASYAMAFFEKSRSIEIFAIAREKLVRMLQAVENSQDARVTADMKNTLRKRIESFEKVNGLLVLLDSAEGYPDQLHKVAVTFNNEDWRYFYDRFNAGEMRDRDGKPYLVDANGVLIPGLNLTGEAENAFSYQYLVDRWRVNRVQEMMRRNLNPNNPFNADETWIVDKLNAEINDRLVIAIANGNNAEVLQLQNALGNINLVWGVGGRPDDNGNWQSDNPLYHGIKMKAVEGWYKEDTWLGADGYENGRLRTEIWEELIVQKHLRSRLQNAGVSQDRIGDLLGKLQNPNPNVDFNAGANPIIRQGDYDLVSTITRNGYYISKFKLADTLDRHRIYGRDGQHITTIWGENTPYGARAVTHFADWMLDEGQGDARSVRELLALTGEMWSGAGVNPAWEGNGQILAQNGTGFRFYGIEGIVEGDLRGRIDTLITQEMANTGNPRMDVEGYIWMNQLMEGINPNNPHDINLALVGINWGEVSENIKSYPVHDMEDDRQKVWNWYNKEFKEWTLLPSPENFEIMVKGYYSLRPKRKHPGTEALLELQYRLGQHLEEWYGYNQNLTEAQFQELVELSERLNLINHSRAERLVTRLQGGEIPRTLRQSGQLAAETARQTIASPGWWAGTAWELLKTLLRFIATGK